MAAVVEAGVAASRFDRTRAAPSRNCESSASVIGRGHRSCASNDARAAALRAARCVPECASRTLRKIDLLAGPAGPHRRQRRNDAGKGIDAAERIGVPAFRAARVEEKIVKVPKDEVVVALRRPQPVAGGVDLEKDLAIQQQSEKLDAGKSFLPAQLLDLLRRRQHGQSSGDLRIADLEQGAGARRFEHHLVAAPSHIGEARQHERSASPICGICGQ